MENRQFNLVPSLPAEIWAHICALTREDTFAVAASCAMGLRTVCKSWASAMDSGSNQFWKQFVETCFPAVTSIRSWENVTNGRNRLQEMYSGLYYCLFRSLHVSYLLKPVQQLNYGRLRCGRPHFAPSLKPQTRWVQPANPEDPFVESTSLCWADRLYVATKQGNLKCFSAHSGRVDWTISLKTNDFIPSMEWSVMEMSLTPSGGSSGLQHDYFVAGSLCLLCDSNFFIIDPKHGKLIRKIDLQQEFSVTAMERSLLVAEGVAIVVCRNEEKKLVAFAFDCLRLFSPSKSVQDSVLWTLQLTQPWCDVKSLVCAPVLDLEHDLLVFGCSFEENTTAAVTAFGVVLLTCSFFNPSEDNLAMMPEVVVEHGPAGPQLQRQLQVSVFRRKAFLISNEYSNAKVHIIDLVAGEEIGLEQLVPSAEGIEAEWLSSGFSLDPAQPRLFISKQSSGGGAAFSVDLTGTKISPSGTHESWSIDDCDSSWKKSYGFKMDKQMSEYPTTYGMDVLFPVTFFGDTIFIAASYGQLWVIGVSNYGSPHTLMPINVKGKKIRCKSVLEPFFYGDDEAADNAQEREISADEIDDDNDNDDGDDGDDGDDDDADGDGDGDDDDDDDDDDMFDDFVTAQNVCIGVLPSQDVDKPYATTTVLCLVTEGWIWSCSDGESV